MLEWKVRAPEERYTLDFFNDTATTEIYTLSLHDALPILLWVKENEPDAFGSTTNWLNVADYIAFRLSGVAATDYSLASRRSEEHTSELQSRQYLVCRLLLEKKKRHLTLSSTILHAPPNQT